jgi:hypothetical protein
VYCKICKTSPVEILSDFGPQPLCNRFVVDPNEIEFRYPLVLGQCKACGLIQLTDPVPSDEIIPRFEWLKYNEPEEHLDDLAALLSNLEGLPDDSVACGLTYKDDSLLRRLNKGKYKKVWRIDPQGDLGVSAKGVAGETVIPRLTQQSVKDLAAKNGRVNLIVARHALEHARDAQGFLESIKYLLKPGGYVVFEVPDCTSQLEECDYSMVWEEHILYFVPSTLKNSFTSTSFELSYYRNYPYPVENALVAIVTAAERDPGQISTDISVVQQLDIGRTYSERLSSKRDGLEKRLRELRESVGKIAIFGAGHLSIAFINLMEIRDHIDFVVDDDPNKQTLHMPGSGLPIRPSRCLTDEDVGLCLLSMSPASESKVMAKNTDFTKKGGTFASIFPKKENSILDSL